MASLYLETDSLLSFVYAQLKGFRIRALKTVLVSALKDVIPTGTTNVINVSHLRGCGLPFIETSTRQGRGFCVNQKVITLSKS